MGCQNVKDASTPTLLCFFETGNETQAKYCLNLRDNFKHEKTINYQIKSGEKLPFKIQFQIKKKIYNIQTEFDNSEDAMHQALNKIYNLLK